MFSFVIYLWEVLPPGPYVFIIFFVQNLSWLAYFFLPHQFFSVPLIVSVWLFILTVFFSILKVSNFLIFILIIF